MSEVKRYKHDAYGCMNGCPMVQGFNGPYVLATDFDHEHQRRVEAERVMERLAGCLHIDRAGEIAADIYQSYLARYKEEP